MLPKRADICFEHILKKPHQEIILFQETWCAALKFNGAQSLKNGASLISFNYISVLQSIKLAEMSRKSACFWQAVVVCYLFADLIHCRTRRTLKYTPWNLANIPFLLFPGVCFFFHDFFRFPFLVLIDYFV